MTQNPSGQDPRPGVGRRPCSTVLSPAVGGGVGLGPSRPVSPAGGRGCRSPHGCPVRSCPSGLGGAIGYVLGGLDWTQTFLGSWFRTQNQVLFFFAAIVFTVSVALHLLSIEEEQYSPQQERSVEAADALAPGLRASVLDGGPLFPDEVQSEHELALDYLDAGLARSKSDSVLHVPDAALDLEPELLFLRDIEPSIFQDASYPSTPRSTSQELARARPPRLPPLRREPAGEDETLLENHLDAAQLPNGGGSPPCDGLVGFSRADVKPPVASGSVRRRRHMFRRQASSTFSYYGKIGSHRYRYRRANAVVLIKPSRSMSDLYDLQKRQRQRCRRRNQSGATTSSGDTESEEGEGETTVRLLWLSMLKMPKELVRLCLCHLLTWFSVIAEAVFYTDFMGQVIFEGDPKVSAQTPLGTLAATCERHRRLGEARRCPELRAAPASGRPPARIQPSIRVGVCGAPVLACVSPTVNVVGGHHVTPRGVQTWAHGKQTARLSHLQEHSGARDGPHASSRQVQTTPGLGA